MIIKLIAKLFFICLLFFVSFYIIFYYRNDTIKNKLLIKKIINKIKLLENYDDIIKIKEINKENETENFEKLNGKENIEYKQDNITIVTAFYAIKSKHSFLEYLMRINNFLKLNRSIVFFTQKTLINIIKEMRPKYLYNKTIFVQMEIKDFYSYKNFGKEFNESFYIDTENNYHTVPLYLRWAEKCSFLKKVILKNYFNSSCFYWVDAGFFVNEYLIYRYINWPSSKKCYENPKVLLNSVKTIPDSERKDLMKFNLEVHKNFQKEENVGGGVFGGKPEYLLMFIDYYYETIKLFISHNIFIGKDQNLFAFVTFLHPEIFNLIYSSGDYYYFQSYLS